MTAYYNEDEKTYFTGKPCKHGHVARRYKSTRTCVVCADNRCRTWQKDNKRKYLDAQNHARRQRLFGLSKDQYEELAENQNWVCAICGEGNYGRALAVDHDHSCCPGEKTCGKCVRGLLCDSCNHGLGKFRDSETLMQAAIRYLQK